jgi:hypothetical protein
MSTVPATLRLANKCRAALQGSMAVKTKVEVPEEYKGLVYPAYLKNHVVKIDPDKVEGHGFLMADGESGQLFYVTVLPYKV